LFQKIPKSEYSTELEEILSNKFKVPTTVQRFKNILNENGLETIVDWKKLSEEEKKKYPDGLKILLNDLTSKFEILKF
jgi:hypothetical protein